MPRAEDRFRRLCESNRESESARRRRLRYNTCVIGLRDKFASRAMFRALLVGALLFAVPGCRTARGPSSQPDVLTIDFWNGFTGPDGATMERMVRAFNRENTDVRVRMQIIPWGTYYDKVTLGLAFGGAPDVFVLHASRLPEYADSRAIRCVDDLISEDNLRVSDFAPRAWAAARWKGKQYAIPLDCHPLGLYYNTKLFKKAGIVDDQGRPKPPTNLAEFIDAAKKLTIDADKDGRPEQWGFVYTWLRTNAHTFLAQHNSGWLRHDCKRSDLDSPNALRAFTLMRSLIDKYRVCPPPGGIDAWVGFQTGRVGMALEGVYMLSSLEQQKDLAFAGAECPVFGDRRAVWADSHMLTMPEGISPEKRRAAWRFIKYLSDNSLEWSKGGQVPVRKSVLARPEFRRLRVQYEFSKELPYVVYMPPSTAMNQILPFADAAVEAVLQGIRSPEEALAEAARRMNAVLERP